MEGEYVMELPDDFSFGDTAGDKLNALIRQEMAKNKGMNFNEAFIKVQEENPALAYEYMMEIRPDFYN
jgi:hypothetical protein